MRNIFAFLFFLSLFPIYIMAVPAQVVIIRHAEKPSKGNNLDTRGRERAAAYVPFFQENKEIFTFGHPVAIYAMKPSKEDPSERPVETVTPLAESLKITINKNYERNDYKKMVGEIKSDKSYNDKMVLICWEHHLIPEIARAFGALQAPGLWQGTVFDRLWMITFSKTGKATFQNQPQRLMFGDSTN